MKITNLWIEEDSSVDAERQVADVLSRTLLRGTSTVEGVTARTWVPPSAEDLMLVQKLGVKAIIPLAARIDSKDPFEQLLVVRLLGVVGGPLTIPALKKGTEPDRWTFVRTQSLSSLVNTPREQSLPIIKLYLDDPDKRVRDRAREIVLSLVSAPR